MDNINKSIIANIDLIKSNIFNSFEKAKANIGEIRIWQGAKACLHQGKIFANLKPLGSQ